jgi:hypothetical protein
MLTKFLGYFTFLGKCNETTDEGATGRPSSGLPFNRHNSATKRAGIHPAMAPPILELETSNLLTVRNEIFL